jgi:hypothetical protein
MSNRGEQITMGMLRHGTILDVISGRCQVYKDKHGHLPARVTVDWSSRAAIVTSLIKAGLPLSIANANPLYILFAEDDGTQHQVPVHFASISSEAYMLLHDKQHALPLEVL